MLSWFRWRNQQTDDTWDIYRVGGWSLVSRCGILPYSIDLFSSTFSICYMGHPPDVHILYFHIQIQAQPVWFPKLRPQNCSARCHYHGSCGRVETRTPRFLTPCQHTAVSYPLFTVATKLSSSQSLPWRRHNILPLCVNLKHLEGLILL